MHPSRALAAAAVAAVLVAACADDGSSVSSGPTGATPPAGATGQPTSPGGGIGSPAPPAQERDEPQDAAEQPFAADRSTDTAPGEGNGLSVVDVRTGTHDGYDRVVWQLEGRGTVGWTARYDDAPARQGSGHPVELEGEAVLSILLEGVGYPFDTGVEEYDGPRRQAPRLPAVRELELGGVYEGYYDAFVGVAQPRPFRVFRLEDPQRVVLDVQHRE